MPAAAPRLEKQWQAQWLAWRLFFDVPRAIPALGRWVARDVTRVIITTWIAASSRRWRGIRSGFRRSERLLSQWNRKSKLADLARRVISKPFAQNVGHLPRLRRPPAIQRTFMRR